ncbi:MAG: ParB/RepB/Spo0J family partition protein [Anaerolineales bacterium]|jgi:ParB family chromosome partitioning protein
MSSRRPGLGKGLDALIPSSGTQTESAGVMQVPVTNIKPNPHQPRTTLDPEELKELAASIKEHGVIQPLILTRGEQEDQYFLIAGERRWQAAKAAGLGKVPAILREATQQDMLLIALIENVQRADLSPLETAEAYRHLASAFSLTHEQIADSVGKSRSTVTNTLSLLETAEEVRKALIDGKISEGHARALKGLSHEQQSAALATIIKKTFSVRDTEELARRLKGETTHAEGKKTPQKSPELVALEDQLEASMGFKTTIRHSSKGGTITIHYYDAEDLNTLADKLLNS